MAYASGAFQSCYRSEHTASCTGPHNGDAGRLADARHMSEVGEDRPDIMTRRLKPCRETMAQLTDRARFFGDSFVDLNVMALCRRYGAERADPPTPSASGEGGARHGEQTARKGVGGGRDPPTKKKQVRLRTMMGIFMLFLTPPSCMRAVTEYC